MTDDLTPWLCAVLGEIETDARFYLDNGADAGGPGAEWARLVLAKVAADRLILAEHLPEWRIVEWPHDQNGKGEARVCPRCQNVEHTHWNPPVGGAGDLPAGFITPYVLAPCATLRLLALPHANRPGYREEWRPKG